MSYSKLYEAVASEAECWCSLNAANPENLSDDEREQCIISTAAVLNLTEEDVEEILERYL